MNSSPNEVEVRRFHRYFAIDCNNLAWNLSTSNRNEELNMQMLDAAHASAYHWKMVGNELNVMRSKMNFGVFDARENSKGHIGLPAGIKASHHAMVNQSMASGGGLSARRAPAHC